MAHAERHDYAALVGSTPGAVGRLARSGAPRSAGRRGLPGLRTDRTAQPARCDDTAYGKGTGGQLRYDVPLPRGATTLWFAVAGSDHGWPRPRHRSARALRTPASCWPRKIAAAQPIDTQSRVDLPGDPQLASAASTGASRTSPTPAQKAPEPPDPGTNAGTKFPAPFGTVAHGPWFGAGCPDYPWIFGTDGEYTAFAAVAAGQFGAIEDHLRALRRSATS